ncbi:MAG TPA: hypothetical protein VG674_27260 [Amycolatopsis sp.]|nr:hypothetical protein [Amycolatopsis sp.]
MEDRKGPKVLNPAPTIVTPIPVGSGSSKGFPDDGLREVSEANAEPFESDIEEGMLSAWAKVPAGASERKIPEPIGREEPR